jgi:magnesium chelatase family protein
MDRINIHIDVPAVNYKEIRSTSVPEGSAQIRERVIRARQIQLERLAGSRQKIYCNAQMSSSQVRSLLRTQRRLRAPVGARHDPVGT